MDSNDELGFRTPVEIREARRARESGVRVPFVQTLLLGGLFILALCVSGLALRVAYPVAHWVALSVFACAGLLANSLAREFPLRWMVQSALITGAGVGLSRALVWLYPDLAAPRWLVGLLLVAALGIWLSFLLLAANFTMRLMQTSAFMEQYGWSRFFAWLFDWQLRKPQTAARRGEPVHVRTVGAGSRRMRLTDEPTALDWAESTGLLDGMEPETDAGAEQVREWAEFIVRSERELGFNRRRWEGIVLACSGRRVTQSTARRWIGMMKAWGLLTTGNGSTQLAVSLAEALEHISHPTLLTGMGDESRVLPNPAQPHPPQGGRN